MNKDFLFSKQPSLLQNFVTFDRKKTSSLFIGLAPAGRAFIRENKLKSKDLSLNPRPGRYLKNSVLITAIIPAGLF